MINSDGKTIIRPKYDEIEKFERESFEGIYRIVLGNKYGFMDQSGNILVELIFYVPSGNEYRAGYLTGTEIFMEDAKVGDQYKQGMVSNKGKLILKPEYDDIVADWYSFERSSYIAGCKDNTWKIYNTKGEYVVTVEKGYTVEKIKRKTIYVEKNQKHYILDIKTGKHISKTEFTEYADPFESTLTSCGQFTFISKGDKLGLVNNTSSKIILEMKYKVINSIFMDGKKGVAEEANIKADEIAIIALDYNDVLSLYSTSGKVIVDTDYDNIFDFVDGYAAVSYKNKIGFINSEFKFTVSAKYESARPYNEGLIAVKSNGKWGYVNSSGKVIIKPVYDAVGDFKDGMAAVKLGSKYGYIDKKGKIVVEIAYDDLVGTFTSGLTPMIKDGKLYIVSMEGKVALETGMKATVSNAIYENKLMDNGTTPVSVYRVMHNEKYGLCIIK
ncbi:MAG: repeat-containing protein [Herbinix sp.]|nr:repeat-containing protein [Herbinix sp.]